MHEFVAKHQGQRAGVLCGFDRLVFRGTLRSIAYPEGMKRCLWANPMRLKDFGGHVAKASQRLQEASLAEAKSSGRSVNYLASHQVSKEEVARGIARREGITGGLVCVLRAVEPCGTFEIYRNQRTHKLELQRRYRKCLFLYHYWMHPQGGSERTDADLVSVFDSGVPERAGMVGVADGRGGLAVRAAGQLLFLDRRLGPGATTPGSATEEPLAEIAGGNGPPVEPGARGDFRPAASSQLLLVDLPE